MVVVVVVVRLVLVVVSVEGEVKSAVDVMVEGTGRKVSDLYSGTKLVPLVGKVWILSWEVKSGTWSVTIAEPSPWGWLMRCGLNIGLNCGGFGGLKFGCPCVGLTGWNTGWLGLTLFDCVEPGKFWPGRPSGSGCPAGPKNWPGGLTGVKTCAGLFVCWSGLNDRVTKVWYDRLADEWILLVDILVKVGLWYGIVREVRTNRWFSE